MTTRVGSGINWTTSRDSAAAELWLDDPDGPGPAGDLDPIANLENVFPGQVAGRDELLLIAELVPVHDRRHHPDGSTD